MDGDRPTYYSYFTPAGPITVAANGRAITRIALGKAPLAGVCAPSELTNKAATQVQEYLAGKRTSFSLPLSPCGTPFQQQVWNAVADIPYAQTATAADIACRIGHAGAHRAVGAATRACPFAIAVPLHRLVRANGQPVAKISDTPGKTMCEDETYLAYLRQVFQIAEPDQDQ